MGNEYFTIQNELTKDKVKKINTTTQRLHCNSAS